MKITTKRILRLFIKVCDIFAIKKYLVLGDSHSSIFKYYRFKLYFPIKAFDVNNVEGATVSGLENPNSKTNALEIFLKKLKNGRKYKKIIFLIGEVDTGFVIWYRAEKYNTPVEKMLCRAVQNYCNLLKEAMNYGEILVISTPLPTIADNNDWGEVAGLRKDIKASQIERTELTLLFNQKIKKFCQENNLDYLNLDKDSLGPDGIVKKEFLNRDKNDHHYNESTYSNLILEKIPEYL